MIIQNYKDLAKSRHKKIVTNILEFGIAQAMPQKILPKFIKKNQIIVNKKTISLAKYDKIYLVAFGKAADSMAKTVDDITKIDGGIVVVPKGTKSLVKSKKFQVIYAGHPLPNLQSYRAGKDVKEFVEKRKNHEFVIFLVSGGSSALMCVPEGITFEEKKHVNQVLIKSGATIQEINCVRKHLSAIKGGKLVENLDCDAVALVMSDVINDDLSSIASGYAYYDNTTFYDALKIIKKYKLGKLISNKVIKRFKDGMEGKIQETPKHQKISNIIIAKNRDLLDAMSKKSRQFGFFTKTVTTSGNVISVAKKLATMIQKRSRTCIIFGGEPTVNVTGNGKGGRNQELVLRILQQLQNKKNRFTFVSVGTDGIDGNTRFAGAITDNTVRAKNIPDYLKNNDSSSFFKKYGGLVKTGYTYTNMMDIGLILN
jgi:hydroxypyruvate reductase